MQVVIMLVLTMVKTQIVYRKEQNTKLNLHFPMDNMTNIRRIGISVQINQASK